MSKNYQALGFLETVGMVPALYATDTMLKAANVELISYENIGSTLVAVMISGDVGAVNTAVEAGVSAASIGKLTANNVIPRPIKEVCDIVSLYSVEKTLQEKRYNALGLVEAFGIVYVLQAADAMVKAANVKLLGFENVASGYISILIEGDVGACQASVAAGISAIEAMNGEVYSSVVIPSPHPDIYRIIDQYSMESLLPEKS
jgi:microcompartment protein CcmL/EutN